MKPVKESGNDQLMDRAAERIASSILQLQQRMAFFLNRKASRIPVHIL